MIRKVTDYAPAPLRDFAIYPGILPDSSFLFHGNTIELVPQENVWHILQAELSQNGLPPLHDCYPALGSGSNANPAQLQHKFADTDFDDPLPYREQLQRAMIDAGLTRPPVIPWETVSRDRVAPLERLI